MSLIRWKPWQEVDKAFEPFSGINGHPFDLATDVYENSNAVIVKMHIPGIDPDKLNIKVESSHLHISGAREEKQEVKDEHYYHREIRYGSFERIIHLPCKVAHKDITAEFKDGILTITLPKEERKEAQKISVTRK